MDYYSLIDEYDDDLDDFEEELYVANDDKDDESTFIDEDIKNIYRYEELEDPKVEPLRLNSALLNIGWMCGDPMPDYAHVVFEAVG